MRMRMMIWQSHVAVGFELIGGYDTVVVGVALSIHRIMTTCPDFKEVSYSWYIRELRTELSTIYLISVPFFMTWTCFSRLRSRSALDRGASHLIRKKRHVKPQRREGIDAFRVSTMTAEGRRQRINWPQWKSSKTTSAWRERRLLLQ